MRIRTLILSALAGLLGSSVAQADVSSISFRMGEDGTIRDIQTSLTSDTMALTAPIVEPNGTLTTPEEESERQMDELFLTEEAIEEMNAVNQDTDQEDVLTDTANPTATTDTEVNTAPKLDVELSDAYPRQLTLSPVIPAGANDSATDCATAGGTWTTYGENHYCCNSNAQAYQEGGSWAPLMPQCGCYGANVYRSLKSTETGRVCCRGREQVASLDIGGEGIGVIEEDSPLCYCPDMVNGREVKEITSLSFTAAASGVLFCCAGNNRVQTPTEILPSIDAYCECYNDVSKCNEAECENVGYNWCDGACQKSSCQSCPAPGSIVEDGVGEVCCNEGHKWNEDQNNWSTEITMACVTCEGCSCPDGGTINTAGDACCKGGYVWNDEDAYDIIDIDVCGCPDGSELVRTGDVSVCCYTDTDGTRKYYGMDDTDEDKANAIRWCGCSNGAEKKEVSGTTGYMCCKNGEMTDYTKDVLEAPDAAMIRQYCGCINGLHYADDGSCVECTQDSHCAGRTDNKKKCEASSQTCVECYATSQCETGKLCDDKICKSCEEINPSKRYYANGTCVECTQDSHCASRTDGKTLCDPNTLSCAKCVLHNSTTGRANEGCSGEKGYCIISSGSNRICSACRDKNDCGDGKSCQVSDGTCVDGCGDVGINPTTGECNCSGATPVFDIYRKKCVKCYDSVGRDWTDLGCNKEANNNSYTGWPSKYSPQQTPKEEGKPVCYVKNASDTGQCVTCYNDDHCVGDKICTKTDGTGICDCPAETTWIESTKRCVACTANYGASSGKRKCPDATMPLCSGGSCTCKNNYDSSKKDGDGKCPSNAPICVEGQCTTCPAGKQYSKTDKKCIDCNASQGFSLNSSDKCVCAKGKWKKSDTQCLSCPSHGSCTTENDTKACEGSYAVQISDTACGNCSKHADCAAGKYCKSNVCTKCGKGYKCGCTYCANGSGDCMNQETTCRWGSDGNLGSDGTGCGKNTCSLSSCGSWEYLHETCSNGRPHCHWHENMPSCTACTSGKACR